MHLLYARFFIKALRDMGLVSFGEPFRRLYNQGIILGPDGQKMSKSHGNVVNPDDFPSMESAYGGAPEKSPLMKNVSRGLGDSTVIVTRPRFQCATATVTAFEPN